MKYLDVLCVLVVQLLVSDSLSMKIMVKRALKQTPESDWYRVTEVLFEGKHHLADGGCGDVEVALHVEARPAHEAIGR